MNQTVSVRSDHILRDCEITLVSGDTKYLPQGAFVKYISQQYWPAWVTEHVFVTEDTVLVYSQYGLGFIEKSFLIKGTN